MTFAVAYGALRVAHLALYAVAARGMPELRRAIGGLAVSSAIGLACCSRRASPTAGSRARCGPSPWCSTSAARSSSARGLDDRPEHFAERFGLFVLIALGESVVAIGAGAEW